ncbi:MAG: T9SS type A sorting domain-containing protein [Taibaiella sp.]|nr:T9SS type A sorting domain-containing protein [Taibaiella sp.]
MKFTITPILALIFLLSATHAYSQSPYRLTTLQGAYEPLTDGIVLNNTVWFNSDFYVLPLPFPFKIDTIPCTAPFIEGGTTLVTDTGKAVISAFFLNNADLIDKGFLGSDLFSKSPIRYIVSGVPGAQIFKLEIANAGFFNEITFGTDFDSVYMQIWLYEGTNVIEFRYGPSYISHLYNYFPIRGLPFAGYVCDVDYSLDGVYYSLTGDPVNPSIDTVTSDSGRFTHTPLCLASYPASGTVYRFTPNALDIKKPEITNAGVMEGVHIYPTACHDRLMIEYEGNEDATYSIISVTGAEMHRSTHLAYKLNTIDVSMLPPGSYMIELRSTGGLTTHQKFTRL